MYHNACTGGKSKTMGDTHTKYNRDYLDEAKQIHGGIDMTGSYKCLPDNNMRFDVAHMRSNGYQLYQDFVHDDGSKTRWWFYNIDTWKARIMRIEGIGYTATDRLKVT